MDPDLKDKIALFSQLKTLQDVGDDDETFGAEEADHRAKCRAFSQLAQKKTGSKSQSNFRRVTQSPRITPRRVASDPAATLPKHPNADATEVIVIEDTPQPRKPLPGPPAIPSRLEATSHDEGTTIPDSAKRSSSQPSTRTLRPRLQKSIRSSPPAGDSPSVSMAKRKRPAKIKLASERQQYFKGLSFFYIPNDDINPVRERRITKSREHGASWVRSLDEATHVIVDANLTYSDIEKILTGTPGSLEKIIVNDSYPIECVTNRNLLNPDQERYRVRGLVQSSSKAKYPLGPQQEFDKSLEIKPVKKSSRKGYVAPNSTPPRSDASTQRSTQKSSISNVISKSQLGSQGAAVAAICETSPLNHKNHDESHIPLHLADDELSNCIDFVRANQETIEDSGGDDEDVERPTSSADSVVVSGPEPNENDREGESSEEERIRKKQRALKGKGRGTRDADWQGKFACMRGGTKDGVSDNPNEGTIAVLQEMCNLYTTEPTVVWQIPAYRRAIATLRQQKTKITTAQQAKELSGIGDRIADHIEEIVRTGRFKKKEEAQRDPKRKVRELFLKIYDVGLARADNFIKEGHRTLEDLLEKANLTRNQRIGIEHFEDLNMRIPRAEVEALGKCVRRTAHEIDPRVELLIGGSYRRGADSSGDIDFIVTKKGSTSSGDLLHFLNRLVKKLTDEGFLTVGLATSSSADGSKWHGCCVLPKEDFPGDKAEYKPTWRRIDFLLVPETEFGAALIYFTGNDLFNRSLRLLASRKGMNLNQRGLFKGVMRDETGKKTAEGELIEGRDEKKIFEALGVQWREPHQRWC